MVDPPGGGGVPLLLLSCSSSSHSRRCRIESWKPTWMGRGGWLWGCWVCWRPARCAEAAVKASVWWLGLVSPTVAMLVVRTTATAHCSARRNSNGQLYSARAMPRLYFFFEAFRSETELGRRASSWGVLASSGFKLWLHYSRENVSHTKRDSAHIS